MLRVTCPCGAPYSLGDHLAGRQFKCPKCGRVLKVGAPSGAGPAPQQRPPSGGGRRQSGWGSASSGTGAARPPQQAGAPKKPASGAGGLGFADEDGLLNSMDNSREQPKPSPSQMRSSGRNQALRKSGSGRVAKRTSGSGPARPSGSGNRRSSSRQRPAEPPAAAPDSSHSRSCPVCEATIARVAPECPSCGVVLRGPSAAQRLKNSLDWSKLTGAIVPLAVIGAIGYGIYVWREKNREPEVVVRPTPRVTKTPEPTPTETAPTPTETPKPTPTAPVDKAKIIPQGELAADFERLRDANGSRDIRDAIKALAAKPGAPEALAQAKASEDPDYKLRVHRAALLAGDEETRRGYIDASLEVRSGDAGLALVYTVIAALDLDAPVYEEKLLAIGRGEVAAEWAKLAIRSQIPDLGTIKKAADGADADSRLILELSYCYRRDGTYLESSVDALEYPSETVRTVALKGIKELAGDLGPEGDDIAAWRDWARAYAPIRELLGKACADFVEPRGNDARFEAVRAAFVSVKELCKRPEEVFKFLPVFYRDSISETERTGQVLGLIVARVGADHAREVTALLEDLDRNDIERRGSEHIVRGALLGLGAKAAKPISGAITRGAIPLSDPFLLPVLLERADKSDVQAFLDLVQAKDDGNYWLAFSAMRAEVPEVEDWLRRTTAGQRYDVAARMALTGLQRDLVAQLKRNEYGPAPLDNSVNVSNFLAQVGTHDVASDLAKLATKEPERVELFDAFGQLAAPDDINDLSKVVKDDELGRQSAERAFKAIAAAGGAEAYKLLRTRIKRDDDPHRESAMFVIQNLPVDDKRVRARARRPFEGDNPAIGDPAAVALLGRVGGPKEQEMIWKACYEGLGSNAYSYNNVRVLFVALGRMGYNAEVAEGVQGYLYAGHRFSGLAAICFTLFFHRERDEAGAAKVGDTLLGALDGAEKSKRPSEVMILAALATIDRKKVDEPAVRIGEAFKITTQPNQLAGIAFALSSSGSDEAERVLEELACFPSDIGRKAVAQGIAFAGLASISERPARALQLLRYDRDEEVRALAAMALALGGDGSAARELEQALALPEGRLNQELQPQDMQFLIPAFETVPLRAYLWQAAERLLGISEGQRSRWHPALGRGRVQEIERDLRSQLRSKS